MKKICLCIVLIGFFLMLGCTENIFNSSPVEINLLSYGDVEECYKNYFEFAGENKPCSAFELEIRNISNSGIDLEIVQAGFVDSEGEQKGFLSSYITPVDISCSRVLGTLNLLPNSKKSFYACSTPVDYSKNPKLFIALNEKKSDNTLIRHEFIVNLDSIS